MFSNLSCNSYTRPFQKCLECSVAHWTQLKLRIMLAWPCILWSLIMHPSRHASCFWHPSASLHNDIWFPPDVLYSLFPSPPLLSHINSCSPFRAHLLYNPLPTSPAGRKTKLGDAIRISMKPWGLVLVGGDSPGKLPFNSPHPTVDIWECIRCHQGPPW